MFGGTVFREGKGGWDVLMLLEPSIHCFDQKRSHRCWGVVL